MASKEGAGNTVAEVFKVYASEGKGTEMTVKDMTRWCKETNVLGQNLSMQAIQAAFEEIRSGARTLKVADLDKLLSELAKRYKDDKKIGISQAQEDLRKKLSAQQPPQK